MPRLTIFTLCDNVLTNKDTESVSLISIMTHVSLPPFDVAYGTLLPLRWYIFAQWEISEEEQGKHFEQRICKMEGEEILSTQVSEFDVGSSVIHHRGVTMASGFPYMPAGRYRFAIALRQHGEEWSEKGSYQFSVFHMTPVKEAKFE